MISYHVGHMLSMMMLYWMLLFSFEDRVGALPDMKVEAHAKVTFKVVMQYMQEMQYLYVDVATWTFSHYQSRIESMVFHGIKTRYHHNNHDAAFLSRLASAYSD